MTKSYLMEINLKKSSSTTASTAAPTKTNSTTTTTTTNSKKPSSLASTSSGSSSSSSSSENVNHCFTINHQSMMIDSTSIDDRPLFDVRQHRTSSINNHSLVTMLDDGPDDDDPPMAYMNGNSVRPIRRRHFSQQQTGGSFGHFDDEPLGVDTVDDSLKTNKTTTNNDNDNHHQNGSMSTNKKLSLSSSAATIEPPVIINKKLQQTKQSSFSIVSNYNKDDLLKNSCDAVAPARQISTSMMIHDHDNNNERMINRLAKGIEKVLRMAKESRRLNCTELLVPHMLMTQIAADVIDMAECEPCGLRGCLLLICLEDQSASNHNHQQSNTKFNQKLAPPNHNGPTGRNADGQQKQQSTMLLGEFAIDSNVVPTFEVFLTLKRVEPSWFESLENRFFKKTPIILSEVYLLNKKKLYQPSSPFF